MQTSALRALEFDRIVEAVTDFALTPMGAERLSRLTPSVDPQQGAQWRAAPTGTARFGAADGLVPRGRAGDPPPKLTAPGGAWGPTGPLRAASPAHSRG